MGMRCNEPPTTWILQMPRMFHPPGLCASQDAAVQRSVRAEAAAPAAATGVVVLRQGVHIVLDDGLIEVAQPGMVATDTAKPTISLFHVGGGQPDTSRTQTWQPDRSSSNKLGLGQSHRPANYCTMLSAGTSALQWSRTPGSAVDEFML